MRRVKPQVQSAGRERGAVAAMVAILVVVLVGAGAMAVDVGRVYSERAQLQNGADAAALAIATDCAENNGCLDYTVNMSTAQGLADGNALDSKMAVDNIDTTTTLGQVTVWTSVREADDSGSLTLSMAKALGIDTMNVGAYSIASWGGPLYGPAAWPLAFNPCQFEIDGTEQAILTQGAGQTCVSDNGSGAAVPGGFEWVDPDGTCSATVEPDDPDTTTPGDAYMSSKTGASMPKDCKSIFEAGLNTVVLFPVWDDKVSSGTGAKYYIKGYAAFKILGYRFPSAEKGKTDLIVDSSGKKTNGIQGTFVEYVADPSEYTGGGYTGGGVTLPPQLIH